MGKPSVIFFNRVYPPVRGASGRVLRDLARGFARDGWEVTVVTTGPEAGDAHDGPIRIKRLKSPRKAKSLMAYFWVWLRLFGAGLREKKHDLVVTLTDPPLLVVAGSMIARIKGARHVHWCHDLFPDLLPALGLSISRPMMKIFKSLSRGAMKRCDKVVVIGRCMAEKLKEEGLVPGRIAVIPNWPDKELLNGGRAHNTNGKADGQAVAGAPVEGARPFDELLKGDETPKFRVLYSGNLGRAHPFDIVIDAAEILQKNHDDIEFVFVGDGPNFDRLSSERDKRGLENIRFLPYQPASRLREMMESGDVHLISMTEKASGLLVPCKLYAAFAVKRPCIFIGPAGSEAAQAITDFKAGTVVAQDDAEKLAETIRTYRSSREVWMNAYKGAGEAGDVFVPREAIAAWLERARTVVESPAARR